MMAMTTPVHEHGRRALILDRHPGIESVALAADSVMDQVLRVMAIMRTSRSTAARRIRDVPA
jgi:hypothetical protein